jgi:hypothetical protein
MGINGKKMVLGPGDTYTYGERKQIKEDSATLNVLYTHTYVNHGFIDKTNIGTNAAGLG